MSVKDDRVTDTVQERMDQYEQEGETVMGGLRSSIGSQTRGK